MPLKLYKRVIACLADLLFRDAINEIREEKASAILLANGLEARPYKPDFGVADPAVAWAIRYMTRRGHVVFIRDEERIVGAYTIIVRHGPILRAVR